MTKTKMTTRESIQRDKKLIGEYRDKIIVHVKAIRELEKKIEGHEKHIAYLNYHYGYPFIK